MTIDAHRIQPPLTKPLIYCFDCPAFSSFRYLLEKFNLASRPIHRAFSIARTMGCHTMVMEEIQAIGILDDDNQEVKLLGGWTKDKIYRFSFWNTVYKKSLTTDDLQTEDLAGYIIIKLDGGVLLCNGGRRVAERWYVFEGVFRKNDRSNNYLPHATIYNVAIGGKIHKIPGVLYCQQNGINKCCAHVALRSILSRGLPEHDISYKNINEIIRAETKDRAYYPGDGLYNFQVQAVLKSLGLPYFDRDYQSLKASPNDPQSKFSFPYQSYLYSGVETGIGALLTFRVGKNVSTSSVDHAIPIFGHTFNKDTWVADADATYFELSKDVGYIRSDSWLGNFIVHDDNHGPNYCIPRMQLPNERVDYVCAVHAPGVALNPMLAETWVVSVLVNYINKSDTSNIWNAELSKIMAPGPRRDHLQSCVLRTITVDKAKYIESFKNSDGKGSFEDSKLVQFIQSQITSEQLTVVEISLPQLFPANKHKVGEFVFDGGVDVCDDIDSVPSKAFLFARLPGKYFFTPRFVTSLHRMIMFPSAFSDHVPLIDL